MVSLKISKNDFGEKIRIERRTAIRNRNKVVLTHIHTFWQLLYFHSCTWFSQTWRTWCHKKCSNTKYWLLWLYDRLVIISINRRVNLSNIYFCQNFTKVLNLCRQSSYCQFDEKSYQQIIGLLMGSPIFAAAANIHMESIESELLNIKLRIVILL